MNWSDERYVKLYTRDTLTWLSLGFEARAVLALLLRKVNGAGIMETGTLETARAVAMQIVAPVDVVRTALAELVELQVVELVPNGVAITNFVEAQEATKTETLKKRDQRQRALDQRRQAQLIETLGAVVPARPRLSPLVPLQPSPAQLTTSSPPAQPSPPPAQRTARAPKPKAQVELIEAPPPPPRPPTRIGKLHEFYLEQREARYVLPAPEGLDLGDQVPPDEPPDWGRSAAALAQWLKRWPDEPPERQDLRIQAVILTWLDEPYWASPKPDKLTGKVTPFPWGAFCSEDQFAKACAKAFPPEAA